MRSPSKINWQARLRMILKRVFIRLWISPFYILVVLPYVVLATTFGDSGEVFLYKIVNFLNGYPGSEAAINEGDIFRATAVLFVVMNVLAEIVLYIIGRSKTGIRYRTDILIRGSVCVCGWLVATGAALAMGEGADTAIMFVGAALVCAALFGFEFLLRRVLSSVFTGSTNVANLLQR